jgi:hypothetical protein
MSFYNHHHKHYGGIDLHARSLYACIQDSNGGGLVHSNPFDSLIRTPLFEAWYCYRTTVTYNPLTQRKEHIMP